MLYPSEGDRPNRVMLSPLLGLMTRSCTCAPIARFWATNHCTVGPSWKAVTSELLDDDDPDCPPEKCRECEAAREQNVSRRPERPLRDRRRRGQRRRPRCEAEPRRDNEEEGAKEIEPV